MVIDEHVGTIMGEKERLTVVTVMVRIFYHAGVSKTTLDVKIFK